MFTKYTDSMSIAPYVPLEHHHLGVNIIFVSHEILKSTTQNIHQMSFPVTVVFPYQHSIDHDMAPVAMPFECDSRYSPSE